MNGVLTTVDLERNSLNTIIKEIKKLRRDDECEVITEERKYGKERIYFKREDEHFYAEPARSDSGEVFKSEEGVREYLKKY